MIKPLEFILFSASFVLFNSCTTIPSTEIDHKKETKYERRTVSSISDKDLQLSKFKLNLEVADVSQGHGLKNADLYIANQKEPVFISKHKQVLPNDTFISLGHTLIDGTPTRIYLDDSGHIAFMAFDEQAVRLLSLQNDHHYKVIEGHGIETHGLGFSTALGQPLKISTPVADVTVDELKKDLGSEGQEVQIDYASGISITGVIEKFSSTEDQAKALLMTFKSGTCKVTYGVHTLFQPAQGEFNLLIENDIHDSQFKSNL